MALAPSGCNSPARTGRGQSSPQRPRQTLRTSTMGGAKKPVVCCMWYILYVVCCMLCGVRCVVRAVVCTVRVADAPYSLFSFPSSSPSSSPLSSLFPPGTCRVSGRRGPSITTVQTGGIRPCYKTPLWTSCTYKNPFYYIYYILYTPPWTFVRLT